jgi:Tfp pilus assembly PilM family ATPase
VSLKEKTGETTSTERLLDIIRGKSNEVGVRQSHSLPKRPPYITLHKLIKLISSKTKPASKSMTVGIDIGYKYLNMVKASRENRKLEILEYKSIPLPADLERGSNEFNEFLRSTIGPFCGDGGKTNVWAIMSAANVDVRPIRIPKVSKKNIEKTVYWTLKKEASFDEKNYLFDYEVMGEAVGSGGKKLDVICYMAPLVEVEGLRNLFTQIGAPLSGLSIVSFAVQNLFINRVIQTDEKHTATLFIGNEYSRIDIYIEGRLIMTRDIKTGINSMIEMLTEAPNILTGTGEKLARDEARKALFAFAKSEDKPVVLSDGFNIDREEFAGAIAPVLERFVRQVERTLEHFTTTLGYERFEKMYVSSIMPLFKAVFDYFGEQLSIQCELFDPLKQLIQEVDFGQRNAFVPSYGMALSDNAYTPNFIYTYKDKNKAAYVVKTNKAILTGLIISLLACSVFFAYEWQNVERKKAQLAQIEQLLQKSAPLMSKEKLSQMVSEVRQKQQKYLELSKRYKTMAFIGELSALTPETVSLTSVKFGIPEKAESEKTGSSLPEKSGAEKTKDGIVNATTKVFIEGAISSQEDMVETILASYIMQLRSSPMFSDITDVSTSKTTSANNRALLTFALNMKAGPGK